MKRIVAQARKEMKHFRRDRLTMALSVLMPVVMVWIFGVTIALNPDHVALLIEDHDRTPASRAYVDAFAAALTKAISMTSEEQRMRMRAMRKVVAGRNVFNWASDILEGLESLWTKPLLYSVRGWEETAV